MKQIALVGAGAVGALYGSKLHALLGSEHCSVLVDEGRRTRYQAEGIYVNKKLIPFSYRLPTEVTPPDYIIIATKNGHLKEAIEMIRPAVGPETTLLSLLNGIESERLLAEAFGAERVLYGFAVGLNATKAGNAITYSASGRIVFGEKDDSKSERVVALHKLFTAAKIASVISEQILVDLYNKFMLNTAYNTISGLLGATYGQLDHPAVYSLARAVSQEVQAVANAEGVVLPDSFIEENHQIVISLGGGMTSMAQDMVGGRETENAWFCGTVIALGAKHGIPTPVAQTLNSLVEAQRPLAES